MSTPVAVGAGLAAAALFAAGNAIQFKAVRPAGHRSLRQAVTTPLWLAGTAVLAGGLGLHAFALHEGPLTLVQPLLILGLLFALAAGRFVGAAPLDVVDTSWAALLVGSIVLFLLTATPASQPAKDLDTAPALIAFVLSAGGVLVCLAAARTSGPRAAPTLLGAAAGIALAGSAALLKVCGDIAAKGGVDLMASWQLYALVAVGASGLAMSQMAYRAGPMTASLPATNVLNPVLSVAIGWGVFDERFRTGAASVALEVLSLSVALTATVALSRRSRLEVPLLPPVAGGEVSP
ncbi:MAG: DMT family transporter [Acidobacteriota bacterium]|nr:DMT family transporter [Acidobacteriota bacterium]